jgi:hypothetical protein
MPINTKMDISVVAYSQKWDVVLIMKISVSCSFAIKWKLISIMPCERSQTKSMCHIILLIEHTKTG